MTENRKRVSVTITGQQRTVTIRAPVQTAGKTVIVDMLPVRTPQPYTGAYEVSPTFAGETLYTNGLRMTNDVTIDPIYVADTSNPAGGITIYIGGEFSV